MGDSFSIHATSDNSGSVTAHGGTGGLFSAGAATSQIILSNPLTRATVGAGSTVASPNAAMTVLSEATYNLQANSDQSVTAGIASNQTQATAEVNGAQTLAEVGAGANIVTASFSLTAKDTSVFVYASANSSVPFDLAGSNNAYATVVESTHALAHVFGGGTQITGLSTVNIIAETDDARTETHAVTTTTGLTGTLYSTSDNTKDVNDHVAADAGSHITTRSLSRRLTLLMTRPTAMSPRPIPTPGPSRTSFRRSLARYAT